ncbi:hypothetical protein O9929_27735 [Vibrio lentus]|nr:hypothetical protein [Vibrio lentus]
MTSNGNGEHENAAMNSRKIKDNAHQAFTQETHATNDTALMCWPRIFADLKT